MYQAAGLALQMPGGLVLFIYVINQAIKEFIKRNLPDKKTTGNR